MPENNQPIGTDATGFDILTQAVRDLLNRFPGLEPLALKHGGGASVRPS